MASISEETLSQAVLQLLQTVKTTIWSNPPVDDLPWPGWYDPTGEIPAYITLRASLDRHQRLLTIVHELTHACLHPPASSDYVEVSYLREEICSHEAAEALCGRYGITDYRSVMFRQLKVAPKYLLRGTNPSLVRTMVGLVGSALDAPLEFPFWANPHVE